MIYTLRVVIYTLRVVIYTLRVVIYTLRVVIYTLRVMRCQACGLDIISPKGCISSAPRAVSHQPKGLYLIKPQGMRNTRVRVVRCTLRVMIYQACGLDKKSESCDSDFLVEHRGF